MRPLGILELWGKTDAENAGDTDAQWHPLLYHLLDAAACAETLLATDAVLAHRLAQVLGFDIKTTVRLVCYLMGLHDLGKCAQRHLARDHERYRARFDDDPAQLAARYEHGAGLLDLVETSPEAFALPAGPSRHVWRALIGAFAGHHGVPGEQRARARLAIVRHADFGSACHDAALEIARTIATVLRPPATVPDIDERASARASLALSGLATLADWIGSNTEWFPYAHPVHRPDEYWAIARERAANAIETAGFGLKGVQPTGTGRAGVTLVTARPSPRTRTACLEIADARAAQTLDRGVYIACATRDEAHGVFTGLANTDDPRSVTLAYAGVLENVRAPHWWAAKLPHFAFFADIGVGTIDQALLAVTAHRHHPLRLAGLMRRTLVVPDAADATHTAPHALERLIDVQATLGGSTVLAAPVWSTEATTRIGTEFARGRTGTAPGAAPHGAHAMAALDDGGWALEPAPPGARATPALAVRQLASTEEAIREINAGNTGRALYITPSVDTALEAHGALTANGVRCALLGARRIRADRRAALAAFEAGSTQVLVATPAADRIEQIGADTLYAATDAADRLIARIARHAREGTDIVIVGSASDKVSAATDIAELARTLKARKPNDAERRAQAKARSQAGDVLIDAERGNRTAMAARAHHSESGVRDESGAPTLRLAVRDDLALTPMAGGTGEAAWRESEARSREIATPADETHIDGAQAGPKANVAILVFERTDDGALETRGVNPAGHHIRIRYDEETGLETEPL